MSKLILFSILLIGTLSLSDSADDKISVSVYYESLCPDSIKFFTTQLYPTYTSPLKRYFNLKLIPYGKSSQRRGQNGWEFDCHHGPKECYGNKVQGCILRHISNEADQLKYINCLMSLALANKNGAYPLDQCARSNNFDTNPIVQCANSTDGNDVLSINGDLTSQLNPQLTSVPTVVFNENFNKKDQDQAFTDFKSVLCSYIKGEHPHECHSSNSASVHTSAVIPMSLFMSWYYL